MVNIYIYIYVCIILYIIINTLRDNHIDGERDDSYAEKHSTASRLTGAAGRC